MTGWRGLAVGALGLTAFYNLVTLGPSAQSGLNTLTSMPGKVAQWLIRPDEPLIPLRGSDWAGGTTNPKAGDGGGDWGTTSSLQTPVGNSGVQTVLAAAQSSTQSLQYT